MSAALGRHPDSDPPQPAWALRELVVCSLEAWDDVWRRNQFFTDALLRRSSLLRVLFVEPPADPLFDLVHMRRPAVPWIRPLRSDDRLHAFRPLKLLPRGGGSLSDRALYRQVAWAARRLRLASPTLWLNDVTYAPMARLTGWPMVYDVTDDWLLAPLPPRELSRLRTLDALALRDSDEVVVCSQGLAASRGTARKVTLIPNGVDSEHVRRPRPRPTDLPPAPTAVYVGTLHDARLDIELVIELARSLPALSVALVGPDALAAGARRALDAVPNIHRLGARPYIDVPAYLQHAQVLIVPHRVTPFTQSLDPIKAYEYAAVGGPTVTTPVAGFRPTPTVVVVPAPSFVEAVRTALETGASDFSSAAIPTWDDRTAIFESVLGRANLRTHPNQGK